MNLWLVKGLAGLPDRLFAVRAALGFLPAAASTATVESKAGVTETAAGPTSTAALMQCSPIVWLQAQGCVMPCM